MALKRRLMAVVVSCVAFTAAARDGSVEAIGSRTDIEDQNRLELDLRAYEALVGDYRNGDAQAVTRIAGWSPQRLAVVDLVIASSSGPSSWTAPRLVTAAMLHTDAARLLMGSNESAGVSTHLDLASRLFQRAAPSLNALASRWYVAVARVLRDRAWLSTADALLDAGRQRLAGDPAVLCEGGTLAELLATDREVTVGAGTPATVRSDHRIEDFQQRRTDDLIRASRWLQQSLDAGSSDALCRLHFGRVRSLLGDDEAARPVLRDLQNGPDIAVGYLASMFLGAMAERRNDRGEAERCYRAALGTFRDGQAAQVALSSVLLTSGRVSEARDVLGAAIDPDHKDRRDPWWSYHFEPRDLVDANYDALRAEALR